MRRSIAIIAILCVFGTFSGAQAQNLLVNGNLDLTPATVYYDGFTPANADDVPGWLITLGAADGSYVLVSPDATPGAGVYDVDMGTSGAGGGLETAALSRPAVTPGSAYRASLTTDNYFFSNVNSYYIDWFDAGGTYISSVGSPVVDPDPFVYTPYTQLYVISGIAPGTAASAGVRFASSGGYNGLAADHFFFGAIPEPGSAVLMVLAFAGLFGATRRR